MAQKVLIVSTERPDLRSTIFGWTYEDSSLYVDGKPIGYMRSPHSYHPETVLEALADGWKLLSAPVREDAGDYTWWLVKE